MTSPTITFHTNTGLEGEPTWTSIEPDLCIDLSELFTRLRRRMKPMFCFAIGKVPNLRLNWLVSLFLRIKMLPVRIMYRKEKILWFSDHMWIGEEPKYPIKWWQKPKRV